MDNNRHNKIYQWTKRWDNYRYVHSILNIPFPWNSNSNLSTGYSCLAKPFYPEIVVTTLIDSKFCTSTTLEKPSRKYQVKFHSLSQMKSNAFLMRVNYFLLRDRQWRNCCPEQELGFPCWAQAPEAQTHDNPQEGLLQSSNNTPLLSLQTDCLVSKNRKWMGWKLQRSLNLQKRAGLGRSCLYPKLCFQTSFAFYSVSLLWEEVALLWKRWEWELPSNLWDQTIKSFGANLNGVSGRSLTICRQLHAEENIWGGKSDLEQVIDETLKIRRVSPAWNYKHTELHFLILSNSLKTDKPKW